LDQVRSPFRGQGWEATPGDEGMETAKIMPKAVAAPHARSRSNAR
jgi:hypothetical protein